MCGKGREGKKDNNRPVWTRAGAPDVNTVRVKLKDVSYGGVPPPNPKYGHVWAAVRDTLRPRGVTVLLASFSVGRLGARESVSLH